MDGTCETNLFDSRKQPDEAISSKTSFSQNLKNQELVILRRSLEDVAFFYWETEYNAYIVSIDICETFWS